MRLDVRSRRRRDEYCIEDLTSLSRARVVLEEKKSNRMRLMIENERRWILDKEISHLLFQLRTNDKYRIF